MQNNTQTASEWTGLDLLKSLSVAAILFIHAYVLVITSGYHIFAPESPLVAITEQLFFIGLLTTILPTTAGCVMRIAMGLNGLGRPLRKTLLTSLLIVGLGYLMNGLTWGWYYSFSWNMLQTVAVSYLLTTVTFSRFGARGLWILGFALLLPAQPLSGLLQEYNNQYPIAVWIGNQSRFIFWPILPWGSMVVWGFLVGHYYLMRKNQARFNAQLLLGGVSLTTIAVLRDELTASIDQDYFWSMLMRQPAIMEVLGAVGVFCLLLLLTNWLSDYLRFKRYGIVNSYSKAILWIYLMQMIVSYHLAGFLKGHLPIEESVRRFDGIGDLFCILALPLFMLLLGWGFGALIIRFMNDKRYVIRLRKAA